MIELQPIKREVLPVIYKIISDAEIELANLTGRRINLQMDIKNEALISASEITKMILQKEVCIEFNVSWKAVVSANRKRNLVNARKVYSYLSYRILRHTCLEVARDLHRDHTTILFQSLSAQNLMSVNDPIKTIIEEIKTKLYENTH